MDSLGSPRGMAPHLPSFFSPKIKCIYFWLCWIFIAAQRAVAESRGYSLRCMGFSLWCLPLLWSTGSVVVAHGLCCSKACGIFLEQGSNLCSLHWQVDSQLLDHRGSLVCLLLVLHTSLPPPFIIRPTSAFCHPLFWQCWLTRNLPLCWRMEHSP